MCVYGDGGCWTKGVGSAQGEVRWRARNGDDDTGRYPEAADGTEEERRDATRLAVTLYPLGEALACDAGRGVA